MFDVRFSLHNQRKTIRGFFEFPADQVFARHLHIEFENARLFVDFVGFRFTEQCLCPQKCFNFFITALTITQCDQLEEADVVVDVISIVQRKLFHRFGKLNFAGQVQLYPFAVGQLYFRFALFFP